MVLMFVLQSRVYIVKSIARMLLTNLYGFYQIRRSVQRDNDSEYQGSRLVRKEIQIFLYNRQMESSKCPPFL